MTAEQSNMRRRFGTVWQGSIRPWRSNVLAQRL